MKGVSMTTNRKQKKGKGVGGLVRRKVLKHDVLGAVCREIIRILEYQPTVTADDIHRHLEISIDGMRQVAHAFRHLQMAGEIVLIEIVRTYRPGQHGNRIGVWKRAR